MSVETQTPQPQKEFDPSEGNPFINEAGKIAQESIFTIPEVAPETDTEMLERAGREAQELSDANADTRMARSVQTQINASEPLLEGSKTVTNLAIKTGALLAAGAAIVTGPAAIEAFTAPQFSETTQEYVVQDGDGVQNAAEAIIGSEKIDIREAIHHISVDPANIDVLSDGLQPGEVLVIPSYVGDKPSDVNSGIVDDFPEQQLPTLPDQSQN